MSPVGLALFAGKSRESEKGLTAGWTDFCHHAAQLSDTSLIASGADHFEQSRGAQTGMLLQGVAEELQVRSGEAVTRTGGVVREAVGLQGTAYGVGMETELGGNGADFPVLGVKTDDESG